MEKQSNFSVPEGVLADWRLRMNVSQHCYHLAQELRSYFAGYEDLVHKLVCASIDLEDLANNVLPFNLSRDEL